jgi:hypothetical protein
MEVPWRKDPGPAAFEGIEEHLEFLGKSLEHITHP